MTITTIAAANFTPATGRDIDLIVLHSMEAPENATTAESVARYFQRRDVKASAHYCVDSDSIVRCVADRHVAWGAPGANHNGLHVEHAGYARQTRAGWLDTYGKAMLRRSARLVARKCERYAIPARFVDAGGLLRGERGITTHAEVTKAFHRSTHTDPGKGFPIDWYVNQVQQELLPKTYVVKPGDTVRSVAKAHGLTVARLWRMNRPRIFPGERLRVR